MRSDKVIKDFSCKNKEKVRALSAREQPLVLNVLSSCKVYPNLAYLFIHEV